MYDLMIKPADQGRRDQFTGGVVGLDFIFKMMFQLAAVVCGVDVLGLFCFQKNAHDQPEGLGSFGKNRADELTVFTANLFLVIILSRKDKALVGKVWGDDGAGGRLYKERIIIARVINRVLVGGERFFFHENLFLFGIIQCRFVFVLRVHSSSALRRTWAL